MDGTERLLPDSIIGTGSVRKMNTWIVDCVLPQVCLKEAKERRCHLRSLRPRGWVNFGVC
jgi:hypothetical protein